MGRKCIITGKTVLSGNLVSHANNKTKRWFLPNLQEVSLTSEALGRTVRLRVSAHGLRTIDARGGLDAFLTQSKSAKLSPELLRLKKVITKRLAATAAGKGPTTL